MAVAKGQIQELVDMVGEYVNEHKVLEFFQSLTATQAYAKNGSFRKTVDRCVDQIREDTDDK